MKTAKRILAILMAVTLVTALFTACGSKTEEKGDSNKKYKVGILQLVQHEALDAATKGFQDALKEKLGDNVEFDLQNASGESATCATIANGFVANGVDLIMANATPALQAAMAATTTIPVVGTSVTDYATALEIKDGWTGKTGINVTGTADLAPLDKQAEMIKEVCPDAKTVGILYCSAEPNSKYQSDVISEKLAALGLKTVVATIADTNEIAQVATDLCDKVDVIYVPTDNTIASATSALNNVVKEKKIPVIAGEEGIAAGCGVATLSISYYDLGKATGEMAYEILVNGKNPADMEIQYSSGLTKKAVKSRCDELGIKIPDGYETIDATEGK